MEVISQEFNTTCEMFLDLIYSFTNDSDISFYKKAMRKLVSAEKNKIIEQFIIHCYIYKEYVETKNVNFFINYNFENNSIELNNINQNELSFKNYLIDIENSQSIDWIIFNEIIRQKWKQFEVFGIEINNSSIIIKIISIFLILIIGKQII